jgi:hypothetical protein
MIVVVELKTEMRKIIQRNKSKAEDGFKMNV